VRGAGFLGNAVNPSAILIPTVLTLKAKKHLLIRALHEDGFIEHGFSLNHFYFSSTAMLPTHES
jgi:hypothetical protein